MLEGWFVGGRKLVCGHSPDLGRCPRSLSMELEDSTRLLEA